MDQYVRNTEIDGNKAFDWGKTSKDYAKFRDIYPKEFYEKILELGLCTKGQQVLDIGTGTGVLPRNLYSYGAHFTGTDLSINQIEMAKELAKQAGMDICFEAVGAENMAFEKDFFDVVTACQCFWYFDHKVLAPKLAQFLKKDGRLLVLYMAWLPYDDTIAGASEDLVLKYSPNWTGAGETRHPIQISEDVLSYFEIVRQEEFDLDVPFTRESWNGRMKTCRGVEASLSEEEVASWEREHVALLAKIAPEAFTIKHYGAFVELKKKA